MKKEKRINTRKGREVVEEWGSRGRCLSQEKLKKTTEGGWVIGNWVMLTLLLLFCLFVCGSDTVSAANPGSSAIAYSMTLHQPMPPSPTRALSLSLSLSLLFIVLANPLLLLLL